MFASRPAALAALGYSIAKSATLTIHRAVGTYILPASELPHPGAPVTACDIMGIMQVLLSGKRKQGTSGFRGPH